MAVEVHCRQLYCTTSEVHFGPMFASWEEGEDFRYWCYQNHGDPRKHSEDALDELFRLFRQQQDDTGEAHEVQETASDD